MRTGLLGLILAAAAFGADLRMEPTATSADKPGELTVRLDSGGDSLSGLRFDVEYDAARFDLKLEVGPAAEESVKILQTSVVAPGHQRALIFGFNRNRIADGVIAVARLTPKPDAAPAEDSAESAQIRMTKTVGTNAEGEAVVVKASENSVKAPVAVRRQAR